MNLKNKAERARKHEQVLERSPKVQLRDQDKKEPSDDKLIDLTGNNIQNTYYPDSLESRSKGV